MSQHKNTPSTKRIIGERIVLCMLLTGLTAGIVRLGIPHLLRSGSAPSTQHSQSGGQETKGEPATKATSPSTSQSTLADPQTAKDGTAPSTVLISPTGDFVSSHKNVSTMATLSSVCNTSSGAKCQIVFISGQVTRLLPAQTTDLGGATYWSSWTPASIGLTPGNWQIRAIATLDGQSKSSNDALDLEVIQ